MANVIIDHDTISTKTDPNADIRWAMTALGYANKDKAIPDEILIDKKTGEFYYKKPDGNIIKCSGDNIIREVINELSETVHYIDTRNISYTFPEAPTSLFLSVEYPLESRTDNVNILEDIDNIRDLDFFISKNTNGFFVKTYIRSEDIKYVGILHQLYNEKHNTKIEENATIKFNIVKYLKDGTEEKLVRQAGIRLNNLSFVQIDPDDIGDIDTIDCIAIEILSIKSEVLEDVIDDPRLEEAGIKQFISSDGEVWITNLIVDYFIDNMSQIPTDLDEYDDKLKVLSSLIEILNTVKTSAGLTDKDREYIRSLENKINAIPRFFIDKTLPQGMRPIDIFGEIKEITDGASAMDISALENNLYDPTVISSNTKYNDMLIKQEKENGEKEIQFPVTRYEAVIGAPKVITPEDDAKKEPFILRVENTDNEY